MSAAEARKFIDEVQRERGIVPDRTPVASVDELLDVLARDEVGRFEAATQLVSGKPGIDALSLSATIELCWSDSLATLGLVFEELRKRDDAEVTRLTQERDGGREFTDADKQALEAAQKGVAFDVKVRAALDVLAKDHLQTAGTLVQEELRQFPSDPRTYRVAAFYYLLAGDYEHFDTSMKWLAEGEATDAMLQYLRALEAFHRYAVRKEASEFLRKALALNPKLVRAQAKLVLTEDGIDAVHAELLKLEAVAPRHGIVLIAGPSIKSAYQMATAFSRARAARQPAASPTPAGAAPSGTAPTPAGPAPLPNGAAGAPTAPTAPH
jgi:tetratricopeptide (TPR) repeat protein